MAASLEGKQLLEAKEEQESPQPAGKWATSEEDDVMYGEESLDGAWTGRGSMQLAAIAMAVSMLRLGEGADPILEKLDLLLLPAEEATVARLILFLLLRRGIPSASCSISHLFNWI
mmetsp:Transcript_20400/g.59041  ORF Transcript_20400/g.59041 Transcript_20400/m.59041 type:complete len:116 (-) Transcript_20400:249-596(-)